MRRNFLCGLQGREPNCLSDLNAELRRWVWEVANQRVHGTTRQQVAARWDVDQFSLQPLNGRPPYPYIDDELRRVARDAYVAWQGTGIRCRGSTRADRYGCVNGKAEWRCITVQNESPATGFHRAGIALLPSRNIIRASNEYPAGNEDRGPHSRDGANVEVPPLAAYESAAFGGAQ